MTQTNILHEEKREFGLMAAEIDNIFQSRNPQFYTDATQMENQAKIFALILKSIDYTKASFDATFDVEKPQLNEMWLATGEDGGLIAHFTYLAEEKSDAPPVKQSVFFIGKFELNDEDLIHRIAPYFFLHGSVETPEDTNGKEVFFPIESGCRTHIKGQKTDAFSFATTSDEFVQMLCYARQAFEMLLTKQIITVPALNQWLDKDGLDAAFQQFEQIIATKPDAFAQMIEWEKAVHTFDANPFFVGSPAPIRN